MSKIYFLSYSWHIPAVSMQYLGIKVHATLMPIIGWINHITICVMTQPKQHINCMRATLELNYPGLRLPYSSHAYLIDYTWEGKKCRIPCATRLNGPNCKPVTGTSNRAFVDISSLFDWLVKFKEFFRFLKDWRT